MSVEIGPGGRQEYFDFDDGRITVRQLCLDVGVLDAPKILWPSGDSDTAEAHEFHECFILAFDRWIQWRKDTGRQWRYNGPGSYDILPPSHNDADYVWA